MSQFTDDEDTPHQAMKQRAYLFNKVLGFGHDNVDDCIVFAPGKEFKKPILHVWFLSEENCMVGISQYVDWENIAKTNRKKASC